MFFSWIWGWRLLALMWGFQVSFWSRRRPRYFTFVLVGLGTLLMFTWGQRALLVVKGGKKLK
jgi:hypothetical protein